MSGGEQQRVAVARALANDPPVLLADEPTANLDASRGRDLARLLRRLADEDHRSVVIVSHDDRLREISDRVLWLEDGQFREVAAMALDPVCGMSVEPPALTSSGRDELGGSALRAASASSPKVWTATSRKPDVRAPGAPRSSCLARPSTRSATWPAASSTLGGARGVTEAAARLSFGRLTLHT